MIQPNFYILLQRINTTNALPCDDEDINGGGTILPQGSGEQKEWETYLGTNTPNPNQGAVGLPRVTFDISFLESVSNDTSETSVLANDDETKQSATVNSNATSRSDKVFDENATTAQLSKEYSEINLKYIHILHQNNEAQITVTLLRDVDSHVFTVHPTVLDLFKWWNLLAPGGGISNASQNYSGSSTSVKFDTYAQGATLQEAMVSCRHQNLAQMAKKATPLFDAFHQFIAIIAATLHKKMQHETSDGGDGMLEFCYRVSTLVTTSYHPQPPATEAFPNEDENNVFLVLFPMQKTGSFYSLWPAKSVDDQKIVEGNIVWCPFGQVLVLPLKTIKAEGYLADREGHFRGQCCLMLGRSEFPNDREEKRFLDPNIYVPNRYVIPSSKHRLSDLSSHTGFRKHPKYNLLQYKAGNFYSPTAEKEKQKAATQALKVAHRRSKTLQNGRKTRTMIAEEKRDKVLIEHKKEHLTIEDSWAFDDTPPREKFGNVMFGIIHTKMGFEDRVNTPLQNALRREKVTNKNIKLLETVAVAMELSQVAKHKMLTAQPTIVKNNVTRSATATQRDALSPQKAHTLPEQSGIVLPKRTSPSPRKSAKPPPETRLLQKSPTKLKKR